MNLLEGGTALSEQELKSYLNKWLNRLISISRDFSIDRFDKDYYLPVDFKIAIGGFVTSNCLGVCGIGTEDGQSLVIRVALNRLLYKRELLPLLENNFYHEMCHAFVYLDSLEEGFYYIDDDGVVQEAPDLIQQEKYRGDDGGHTDAWFKYVNLVNEVLGPAIPVTAHPDISDYLFFCDVNKDEAVGKFVGHTAGCPEDNGAEYIFVEDVRSLEPEFLNLLIRTELGSTRCGACNERLQIEYYDANFEQDLQDAVRAIMFKLMFGR